MLSNITIDDYITEICDGVTKCIQTFTSLHVPQTLSKYIEFIESSYPVVQITNNDNMYYSRYNNYDYKCDNKFDIWYIDKLATGNMDILCKATKILSCVDINDTIITFPTLCINELGFNLMQTQALLTSISTPKNTFSSYFGLTTNYNVDESIKNNICMLGLMNNLAYKSYKFFDEESPKILLRILSLESINKCSIIIFDKKFKKNMNKPIQKMNDSMRQFLQ